MQPSLSTLIAHAVEHSYDGLMIADGSGYVIYFNEAYKRLTDLAGGTMKPGVNMQALVDKNIIDGSTCMQAICTKRVSVDVHSTKNGTIVADSCPIMDENGDVQYVITNVLDGSAYADLAKRIGRVEKKMNQLTSHFALAAGTQSKGIIAVSKVSRECLRTATAMATYNMPVFISGEVGTGKSMLARFIHDHSNRGDKPFIRISCGALDDAALSEEIFGTPGKPGKIAEANGGTMLVSNVDELSLAMQAKLLRMLDTNTYRDPDTGENVNVNVRVICTSSIPLRSLVNEKKFRSDLYYKLSVLNLTVLPLRERREDIYPTFLFFLEHYNKKYNTKRKISAASMQILEDYSWPGNAREIRNVVEEMVITGTGEYLTIPQKILAEVYGHAVSGSTVCFDTLSDYMDKRERDYLTKVYAEVGSTRKLAEALGVNHSTVMRKLKKYGIHLSGINGDVG